MISPWLQRGPLCTRLLNFQYWNDVRMCTKQQLIKILNKSYSLMRNFWWKKPFLGLRSGEVCVWTVIIQLIRDLRPPKELGPLLCFARVVYQLCSSLLCSAGGVKCRHPRLLQPRLIWNLTAGQWAGAYKLGVGIGSLLLGALLLGSAGVFVASTLFWCAE